MGGQNDLNIGVQLKNQVYETFLPVNVQTHFWLIHEEHIVLIVFHQYGKQDDKPLLFSAG